MRTVLSIAAVLALVAGPLAAQQEQAEPATVLMVSYYQCPQSAIAEIAENYDQYTRPVEEEIVEEGMLASAGLFFHWWADEWNVNYYRTGHDLNQMMEAVALVGERVLERNPSLENEPGPFEVCTAHKDGIYNFGPGTGRTMPQPGEDAAGS